MRRELHFLRLASLAATVGCAIAVPVVAATPGVSEASSPEKEFTTSFEPTCVVDPGILDIKSKVKVGLRAMAPASVAPGETFTLKKASSTITTPVALTENFVAFGATEVKGEVSRLELEAAGAEPLLTNIAKVPEYPEGLPFQAAVEKGKEGIFDIPSLKLGETGLTYTAGSWKVTATNGSVKLLIDSEPGYTEVSAGEYKATGGGIVTELEGRREGSRQIGPLPVDCNPPSGVTALEMPVATGSSLEAGHPELYESGKLVAGKAGSVVQFGWGQLQFESKQLGGEGECVALGFGAGWNEGSPERATGQILAAGGSGHAPEKTHTGLSASCRGQSEASSPGSFLTTEAFAASEENATSHAVEPSLRKESTPWNMETNCGVREEAFASIIRVGVPNSEFPRTATACPPLSEESELIEQKAHLTEREAKKGCYASVPAPEGCIRVTYVEPAAGLEVAFGGSLSMYELNGVKNSLVPTRLILQGALSGELECEFPTSCAGKTATFKGTMRDAGFSADQLIQLK